MAVCGRDAHVAGGGNMVSPEPALFERFTVTYPASGTVIESYYPGGATLREVEVTHPIGDGKSRGGHHMNDIAVVIIKKNAMEDIRVDWREYKGRRYLDIRVYADFQGDGEKTPTKKGVTLSPSARAYRGASAGR